jgi:hypothetical protein
MAESERRPELPTILIVVLALLGITTFRGGTESNPKPETSSSSESRESGLKLSPSAAAAGSDVERDLKILEPLTTHFRIDDDEQTSLESVLKRIHERIDDSPVDSGIRCLIVTVPDPVRSTNSHRFDECFDAVQRGVETQGYVLDGYRFPWMEQAQAASERVQGEIELPHEDRAQSSPAGTSKLKFRTTAPSPRPREPGVVLFRKAREEGDRRKRQEKGDLLLLFLIPESPTLGLNRDCLAKSLDLACQCDWRHSMPDEQGNHECPCEYNILGPCFSGSQASLEQGLKDWLKNAPPFRQDSIDFQVISGMASSIDPEPLKACVESYGHTLTFKATVHQTEAVLRALLAYVGQGREETGDPRETPDLKWMGRIDDVSMIPQNGNNQVIVALVKGVLHIRIFDAQGKRCADTDEENLEAPASKLRAQLECLSPFHKLSGSEERQILKAVANLVRREIPGVTNRAEAIAQIALLTESDTGFGRSMDTSQFGDPSNVIWYRFPSHISQLRTSVSRKGVFGDAGKETIRSAERLTIPDAAQEPADDIIPSQTPAFSAAVDELALDQILTDIARRRIRKVGIVATDPLDVVFLAREVNRFCDDVQLFAPLNDILFAHPQYAADLRGMLVGTTYLLYPRNQFWTDSVAGRLNRLPHFAFPSNEAQGTYNATLAQLLAMGLTGPEPIRFLEYGMPLRQGNESKAVIDPYVPPIWIGVVGNREVYPVQIKMLGTECTLNYPTTYHDYLYQRPTDTPGASPGEPQVKYDPVFETFWKVVFCGLALAGVALAGVTLLVAYWVATKKP